MKLQVLIDDESRGVVELTGVGIIPYAAVVSTFCQIITEVYAAENPDSPDYLTISGAEVSRKSRVRQSRARRRS